MAIRFHLVEPGMHLWQKRRQRMGNTTLSRDAWFPVWIIDKDDKGCIVSWNGNPARRMWKHDVEKLYRQRPTTPTAARKEDGRGEAASA